MATPSQADRQARLAEAAPAGKLDLAMSNPFLVSLFQHKAWCNRGLIEALRAAPADVDRGSMAVMLLTFEHTAIVDQIFKARLLGEQPGFEAVVARRLPDLDGLAATLAATDAWYLDYVSGVTPAELESVVEFSFISDSDEGRMSKGEMLAHVVTHSASHCGAIGKMLEGLNLAGASDMVTSFVRWQAEQPAA
jgi:uncharacterized damage-inducible protein DinB